MQFAALFFVVCLAAFANASSVKKALSLVQALKVNADTCDCNQCSADCIEAGQGIGGLCATDGQCYCAEWEYKSVAKTLGFAIPNIAKVNDYSCECNECNDICVLIEFDGGLCYENTCYCGKVN